MSLVFQHENGECPSCGLPIPQDMPDGGSCSNCGHVFYRDPDEAEFAVLLAEEDDAEDYE